MEQRGSDVKLRGTGMANRMRVCAQQQVEHRGECESERKSETGSLQASPKPKILEREQGKVGLSKQQNAKIVGGDRNREMSRRSEQEEPPTKHEETRDGTQTE
eukprot:6193530-Pleurochrysis_carterae.AAC.3